MGFSNEIDKKTVEIRDDSLWIKHVNIDEDALALLGYMPENTKITFEINGTEVEFAKMADGKDGRPTPGYKPVGENKKVWSDLQTKRPLTVSFRIVERKSS